MSEEMFTPEPWALAALTGCSADIPDSLAVCQESRVLGGGRGNAVCVVSPIDMVTRQDEANARRIVACVNACKGLPTDLLEAVARLEADGPRLTALAAAAMRFADDADGRAPDARAAYRRLKELAKAPAV